MKHLIKITLFTLVLWLVACQPTTPTTAAVPEAVAPTVVLSADVSAPALVVPVTNTAPAPDPIPCLVCDFDYATYDGPLTAEEVHALLLALNDEYHAYAVYGQVISDFGMVRPFTNIQRSEQTHINALVALFHTYDVPVPANPWPAQAPSFGTVAAACQAGVAAELLNRDLYNTLYDSTSRSDIVSVYQRLQAASENNHLPAFQRCTARQG